MYEKASSKKKVTLPAAGGHTSGGNFSLPKNFKEVENPTCVTIDQLEGKELWLLEVPADFDVSSLQKLSVPLTRGELAKVGNLPTASKSYSVHESAADETSQFISLFSKSNEDATLALAPPFARKLEIREEVEVPDHEVVRAKVIPVPQLENLNYVFKPLGYGTGAQKGKRKRAAPAAPAPSKEETSRPTKAKKKN
eukprot:TRINITY_DN1307_c0_g1_i1.p1 TRINITY_DN1307_c0_g1~~TRINITY_DN1307_c0_g1_i1.p1  ORF type:complete len:196 (+),score=28.90 TRINITY_DN1307_c0_g1_i1:65-652(+)